MIQIKNLNKQYGQFSLNISMEIPEGRVSGLVGANGAGKSTTIKAILGLITPDSGEVTVLGKDARHLAITDKKQLGVALSDSGFSSALSVQDIITILENFYDVFSAENFRKQCEDLGLPLNKKIQEFSTGMRAKLKVLIALSHQAKLLILDEPTAGLDLMARKEILQMLRDYLKEDPQRSLLISSHISSDLEDLCDDIYMIDDGAIVLHENTEDLIGANGGIDEVIMKMARGDK